MAHEQIEQAVIAGLGHNIAKEAIVIGSSAIACAVPGFRPPNDLDVVVQPEVLEYLREHPDWQELPNADGETRLVKDDSDVGISWASVANYTGLQARSWVSDGGLRIAGLPDVYAYKQRRGNEQDLIDLQAVRTYLQDPDRVPFPAQYLPHEFTAAMGCLPVSLQNSPDAGRAALLAANGMHIVYTVYGHPEIGQANQVIGDLEEARFAVPATYHNGFGLVRDGQALQRHLANIDAPVQDRLLALAIDPYTDAIYGNGRFSNNPTGHDELRAGKLFRGHALQLGFTEEEAERGEEVVLATTFDEKNKRQRGKYAADPLTRAVVGVDLYPLARPESGALSFDLAIEDGFSARANPARIIGRWFVQQRKKVYSTLDALSYIDEHVEGSPEIKMELATWLAGNASFVRTHQYPDGWTLDNVELRDKHANMLERVSADMIAGRAAVDAYLVDVHAHTMRMREQYGED